jgi:hypothetical protein
MLCLTGNICMQLNSSEALNMTEPYQNDVKSSHSSVLFIIGNEHL